MNVLHGSPNDGQATGFCREGINLIGALPDITKKAFNRIGATNIPMHDRWKGIKRQQVLFLFGQATDGFGIALLVCGFKGRQIQ